MIFIFKLSNLLKSAVTTYRKSNVKSTVILNSSYNVSRVYSERRIPDDLSHIPELNEPPLKEFYIAYYDPVKGRVYDKKPFKLKCQAGKTYYWCPCGWSHDQPLCDGQCVLPEMRIKMKPIAFKPKETRDYWFCNCKQTKNRPFCDGSHNSEVVQNAKAVLPTPKV